MVAVCQFRVQECSGHGVCLRSPTDCTQSQLGCFAACSCDDTWAGLDCSLAEVDMLATQQLQLKFLGAQNVTLGALLSDGASPSVVSQQVSPVIRDYDGSRAKCAYHALVFLVSLLIELYQ